ncbi:hypothetical protein GF386_06390 [Candidatus Pacearchaeota archaeon]|nr:hypothetical protein [Candidatus Pacearchaeota archaeon]MBD3283717.1 hypothetical protein [Candidatus Pacearchaeota archaeon]
MVKKQILIIGIVVVILIALGIVFFYNPTNNDSNNFICEDETCKDIKDIIISELPAKYQITEGTYSKGIAGTRVFVRLNCEGTEAHADEEEIINNIAKKLFEKYPDTFGENTGMDSIVEIIGCSKTSSSPDGISSSSSSTSWGIFDGHVDIRI